MQNCHFSFLWQYYTQLEGAYKFWAIPFPPNVLNLIILFLVGASLARPEELKFLYEIHENFDVLPSFYIMPAMQAMFLMQLDNTVPGKTVSLDNVLHGEHYIELLGPVPADGKLISKPRVVEVLDKSSGAVVVIEGKSKLYYFDLQIWPNGFPVDTFDERGQLVVRNQVACFAVGAGNFGGPKTGTKLVPVQTKPKRKPDSSVTANTTIDQAALYRLSGKTFWDTYWINYLVESNEMKLERLLKSIVNYYDKYIFSVILINDFF